MSTFVGEAINIDHDYGYFFVTYNNGYTQVAL